jgi:two-component system chemotaxis response regulator CheB
MIDQYFHLIIMDINMPKMNGIEAIRAFKEVDINTPIIIISGIKNKEILRSAIKEGAKTYLQKPFEPSTLVNVVKQVLQESGASKPSYFLDEGRVKSVIESRKRVVLEEDDMKLEAMEPARKIVVIGASAGGPQVLNYIVSHLSKMINAAIVIVQHIPFSFMESLITHLKNGSVLRLKEADANEVLRVKTVYVARGGYHMVIKKNGDGPAAVVLDDSPPIFSMKPAVNPTFISAAGVFRKNCLGVVLTGMGIDGTEGARAIKAAGGRIIAQNEETCEVYGMPKSIVSLKLADDVLAPGDIVQKIVEWAS